MPIDIERVGQCTTMHHHHARTQLRKKVPPAIIVSGVDVALTSSHLSSMSMSAAFIVHRRILSSNKSSCYPSKSLPARTLRPPPCHENFNWRQWQFGDNMRRKWREEVSSPAGRAIVGGAPTENKPSKLKQSITIVSRGDKLSVGVI